MLAAPPSITGARDSILIVMRSEPLAQSLKKTFEASGYQATAVHTEAAAFTAARESAPALIIIDRQFGSGTNLRHLRTLISSPIVAVQDNQDSAVPCTEEDCVQDYDRDIDLVLCGPTPRELVARARAILRRRVTRPNGTTHYSVGRIKMDLDRHEVSVNGRLVELTPKEFQILRQFLEFPDRLFSRQEMLNKVWGEGYALEEHALDVHIHSLRQKIEAHPARPKVIVTVRGIGYKLRA
jgi:DNA-binding response OmpR family regulator